MLYTNVFQIHGQLMILVWIVLAPCTIMVARYGDKLFAKTMQVRVHVMLNSVMALLGGYAGYLSVSTNNNHFTSLHQKLGLIIAVLALLQGIMGVMQCRCKKLKKVHGTLGPILWFMAMVNAMLGSEMLGWNATVYLAAYMFLVISLFLYLAVEERPPVRVYENISGKRVSPRKKK